MFEDVICELRDLEHGVRVSIPISMDDEGYLDRRCPSLDCGAEFKVLAEDWRNKVRDEVVYCPVCRFQAVSTEWNTPEQGQYIEKVAGKYLHDRLNKAFSKSVKRFNRQQLKHGFIQMSMSYHPSPTPVLLPAMAWDVMTQKSTCEVCGCRYSSIGAAFFCPSCGHNCAATTFDIAIDTVRRTIESLAVIRGALTNATDNDTAENSIRQICENGLVKLVSAFQRFAETRFEVLPKSSQFNPRQNVFQNLSESSELWHSATGSGYDDMLSSSEFNDLQRFFQQRHMLVHKEGIVDQAYIDRSGDRRYSIGQKLIIRGDDVLHLADLVSNLAHELLNYSNKYK
jgi:uncharacterized Zn finger protein (UPF0148 family)